MVRAVLSSAEVPALVVMVKGRVGFHRGGAGCSDAGLLPVGEVVPKVVVSGVELAEENNGGVATLAFLHELDAYGDAMGPGRRSARRTFTAGPRSFQASRGCGHLCGTSGGRWSRKP
jgi:hypothetical protein